MNEVLDIAQKFKHLESAEANVLTSGNIQKTYMISGSVQGHDSKFILQNLNTSIFPNPEHLVENHLQLELHLSSKKQDQIIPKLMKAMDGSALQTNGSQVWRAQEYIEQSQTSEQVTNSSMAHQGGLMVGQFTAAFLDLDPTVLHSIIPDFHNLKRYLNEFSQAAKIDVANRLNSCSKELNKILDLKTSMIARFESTRSLPDRVCHNDTKISNILFSTTSKQAIKIIDLDTVMLEKVIFDYGDMVRSFLCLADENETDLSKIVVRDEIFEAMTSGFLAGTQNLLTQKEQHALFDGGLLITYEQSIRFLADYLRNDTYYQTRYATHNLDRAKNQLRLLEQLIEKEFRFNSIIKDYRRI